MQISMSLGLFLPIYPDVQHPPKRKPLFSIGSVHFVGAYGEYLILQGNLMKSEDRFSIS